MTLVDFEVVQKGAEIRGVIVQGLGPLGLVAQQLAAEIVAVTGTIGYSFF